VGAVWAQPVQSVTIAVLDKVTAKVQLFRVKVGDVINARDRLKVRVHACEAPSETSFHQERHRCFVEVIDCGVSGKDQTLVFGRWMFRDYPSLGAVEHRRYDAWLVDCYE